MTRRWTARLIRHRRAAVAVCVTGYVAAFAATHLPLPELPPLPRDSDKGMHVMGYLVLGLLLQAALLANTRLAPAARAVLSVGVLAVYGAIDELTQPWVNRHASWADWIGNLVGAGIAAAGFYLATRRSAERMAHSADTDRA